MASAVTNKTATNKTVTNKAVSNKAATNKAVTSKAVTSKAATSRVALIDTGALIAFLSRSDRYHLAAVAAFKRLPSTLVTCEAVLSEVCFLLKGNVTGLGVISTLLREKAISVVSLSEELDDVFALLHKYIDIPMSFADASLVRLTELQPYSIVVTTDSDFGNYRIKKNQKLPVHWIR